MAATPRKTIDYFIENYTSSDDIVSISPLLQYPSDELKKLIKQDIHKGSDRKKVLTFRDKYSEVIFPASFFKTLDMAINSPHPDIMMVKGAYISTLLNFPDPHDFEAKSFVNIYMKKLLQKFDEVKHTTPDFTLLKSMYNDWRECYSSASAETQSKDENGYIILRLYVEPAAEALERGSITKESALSFINAGLKEMMGLFGMLGIKEMQRAEIPLDKDQLKELMYITVIGKTPLTSYSQVYDMIAEKTRSISSGEHYQRFRGVTIPFQMDMFPLAEQPNIPLVDIRKIRKTG